MLASPAASALAHGATGTWLDEFVELGLPLIIFVILYYWSRRPQKQTDDRAERRSAASFWSNRKKKKARAADGEDPAKAAGKAR